MLNTSKEHDFVQLGCGDQKLFVFVAYNYKPIFIAKPNVNSKPFISSFPPFLHDIERSFNLSTKLTLIHVSYHYIY